MRDQSLQKVMCSEKTTVNEDSQQGALAQWLQQWAMTSEHVVKKDHLLLKDITLAYVERAKKRKVIGSPVYLTRSDVAVDTSSEITTKDLKEKKEFVEETENGKDVPANGNTNEENGEQEPDDEVDEEEEEGEEEEEEEKGDGEEEEGDEEAEAATCKWAAEDVEDNNVDTKKQKTDEDD
ncbi:PREDICTED: prothymosin alpha-like [Chrysochloris asiatica]|uniref:Prothymosin alpha n=1 Tax=Chrysochloris asiatica TaxID=185453 RepID=A0A9B0WRP0_CHRAS|nr:PREDICTED: prothymosin alpha-like [Chrysochloris asiatica]